MSNPNPNEPLVRNPNTGAAESINPDDAQIPDNQEGDLTEEDDEQATDDDDIVGPDGNRG